MMRVSLLGWGSIGQTVGQALVDGQLPGAELHSVAGRDGRPTPAACPVPVVSLDRLADGSDVIVEAAGQEALAANGERYLEAGCRLLIVSVGALVDQDLFDRLQAAGGERLYLATGAIGGLDLLRAATRAGPVDELTLTTTKHPSSLLPEGTRSDDPVTVFDGPAAEAVRRFPQSVNVAATLALTAGSWDLVRVRVVADPTIETNRHEIALTGAAGRYHFSFENRPSPANPKTSGVVAPAVLAGLASLVGGGATGGWRLAVG